MHGSRSPNCYISLLTWGAMGTAPSRNVNSDSWAWCTPGLMTFNMFKIARTLVTVPAQEFSPRIAIAGAGF